MLAFQPVACRPSAPSPRLGQYGLALGPSLGKTFDEFFGISAALGDVVRLGFHGATAALGYHVFTTGSGFFKWFGIFLSAGQAVGAICDVISLVQRLAGTHPPEARETPPSRLVQPVP